MTTEDTGGLVDNEELGKGQTDETKQEVDTRETKTVEVRVDATPAERPEGLPEDFWDADTSTIKTTALLDGYKNEAKQKADLRKQISKGIPEAPKTAEEYTIEFDEETAKLIPENDPATDIFKKVAHKQGLSQEQVQAIASEYMAEVAKVQQDAGVTPPPTAEEVAADNEKFRTEQKEILGDEGVRAMESMTARIAQLYDKGSLNDDDKDAFRNAAFDAKGVLFMQKIMSLPHDNGNFIPSGNVIDSGLATLEQLHAMGADERMSDPAFRAKRSSMYAALEARGVL